MTQRVQSNALSVTVTENTRIHLSTYSIPNPQSNPKPKPMPQTIYPFNGGWQNFYCTLHVAAVDFVCMCVCVCVCGVGKGLGSVGK